MQSSTMPRFYSSYISVEFLNLYLTESSLLDFLPHPNITITTDAALFPNHQQVYAIYTSQYAVNNFSVSASHFVVTDGSRIIHDSETYPRMISINKELSLRSPRALPHCGSSEHVKRARGRPECVRTTRLGELTHRGRHSTTQSEEHVRSVVGYTCGQKKGMISWGKLEHRSMNLWKVFRWFKRIKETLFHLTNVCDVWNVLWGFS